MERDRDSLDLPASQDLKQNQLSLFPDEHFFGPAQEISVSLVQRFSVKRKQALPDHVRKGLLGVP
jgi:hypothetical protein